MTDQTRSRLAVALGAGLLVLWGLVVCAGQGRADTLRVPIEDPNFAAAPTVARVPAFEALVGGSWVAVSHAIEPHPPAYRPEVRPASVTVPQAGCVALRATLALADGSRRSAPSNVVTYCPPPVPSLACRADLNADGGVGLDDVGIVFGEAAKGARCP